MLSQNLKPAGCAVERIYVHSSKYDEFVKQFVDLAKDYKVGDPRKPETSLGPVVSLASAARIRKQVKEAGKLANPFGNQDAAEAGSRCRCPTGTGRISLPGG